PSAWRNERCRRETAMTALTALLLAATTAGVAPPPGGPVGVWMASRWRPATAADPPDQAGGWAWGVRYEGDSVYVMLFSMAPDPAPAFGGCRLKARWEWNTLCFRDGEGKWSGLASFVDGRFQRRRGDVVWVLEKVPEDRAVEIKPWDGEIEIIR